MEQGVVLRNPQWGGEFTVHPSRINRRSIEPHAIAGIEDRASLAASLTTARRAKDEAERVAATDVAAAEEAATNEHRKTSKMMSTMVRTFDQL